MSPVTEPMAGRGNNPVRPTSESLSIISRQNPTSLSGLAPFSREELFSLALRGSKDAFTELIRPHHRAIYVVGLAFAGDREDAEEITVRTVCRAFERLEEVESVESISEWLLGVAVATACDIVRFDPEPSESACNIPEGLLHPLPLCCEARQKVPETLLSLPRCQRVIIVLRDALHFTSAQIGSLLDLPPKIVKENLSSARFGMLAGLATLVD